jgi:hypothetical protein
MITLIAKVARRPEANPDLQTVYDHVVKAPP